MIATLVKKFAYHSGLLGMIHRVRNRRSLTVIMFHRVLSDRDPRWNTCDPDYTISDQLYAQSLDFFQRHYNVVSLAQVLAAKIKTAPLPDNALLITFDDGWQDTFQYALPALRARSLPAVLFVAADAIGKQSAFFQEQLIAAFRAGALSSQDSEKLRDALSLAATPDMPGGLTAIRSIISSLEKLAPEARENLLAPLHLSSSERSRAMVSGAELAQLQQAAVAIGLHGKTHTPMTQAEDLTAELQEALAIVRSNPGIDADEVNTLSFPHGKWSPDIVRRARLCGYQLQFTSVPGINRVQSGMSDILCRLGFEAGTVSEVGGKFRPDLLALYLFRRETKSLSVD